MSAILVVSNGFSLYGFSLYGFHEFSTYGCAIISLKSQLTMTSGSELGGITR